MMAMLNCPGKIAQIQLIATRIVQVQAELTGSLLLMLHPHPVSSTASVSFNPYILFIVVSFCLISHLQQNVLAFEPHQTNFQAYPGMWMMRMTECLMLVIVLMMLWRLRLVLDTEMFAC